MRENRRSIFKYENEMKATEQLKEEHKTIKLMLRILEEACGKLESGEEIDPEHLEEILEFIQVFADGCHHAKEEGLLFPAMEKASISKGGGPIGAMIIEHNLGRDYIKGMSEAVAKYKAGDRRFSSKIVKNAREYIMLLTRHIEKEDTVLYRIADIYLSKEEQEELLDKFERLEKEKIGTSKREEFQDLLDHLKQVYLA